MAATFPIKLFFSSENADLLTPKLFAENDLDEIAGNKNEKRSLEICFDIFRARSFAFQIKTMLLTNSIYPEQQAQTRTH